MNSNTSGTNTNNMSAKPTAAKRVAKKSDAAPAAPIATVEVKVAAAAKTTKAVAAASKKAVAAAEAAPAPVVAAAAPVAQAVAAPVAVRSVTEEIADLTKELNEVKESLRKSLTALKTIEKRHGQELKEAKKRNRKQKKETVDGEVKPARPSVFTTPVLLKDSFAVFLGKSKGTRMSPADVTKAVKIYIDEHKLKGDKHEIRPDTRMCEVLGLKAGETLTYKNIQKYLYQQYVKEAKPVA
jgi:hypothetical protein